MITTFETASNAPPQITGERPPHLNVHVDDHGHPYVLVPSEWLWDLVEYLSFHRLNLSYHFVQSHFCVVFLCQTATAAQHLVDHWAQDGAGFEPIGVQS